MVQQFEDQSLEKTALVILAAGASTRMGWPKQLLPIEGKALVRHVAEMALATRCEPVIVVTGSSGEQVATAVDGLPVNVVRNEAWEGGMGTSIVAGVRAADEAGCSGLILALVDQPFITTEIFKELVRQHHASGKPIVASEYAGTVGVPVYFSREYFPNLLALGPSEGCKRLILSHATDVRRVPCPEAERDLDTREEYQALQSPVS